MCRKKTTAEQMGCTVISPGFVGVGGGVFMFVEFTFVLKELIKVRQ